MMYSEDLMDYGTFKAMVEEHFLEYMPDTFQNCEVKIIQVKKLNKTSDGLTLRRMGNGSQECGPVVYVDDMYKVYQKYGSLETALTIMADELAEIYVRMLSDPGRSLEEKFINRDNVILQLVNTGKNRELLKTCPNRPFLDLSIVYKAMVYIGEDKTVGVKVTHQLAKDLGMDEEALYQAAIQNTRKLLPIRMLSLKMMVDELRGLEGEAPLVTEPEKQALPMYVFTNDIRVGGSVALLYKDELDKLAWALGADLYILPSSLHEVIAVPAYEGTLNWLEQMVFEINRTEVEPEDWLSDQVYRYNWKEQTVTVAEEKPADSGSECTVCWA